MPVYFRASVILAFAPAAALGAQQPTPSAHAGAFVIRLGTDTVAVERFTRVGDEYGVEQVRRVPRTTLWHTHVALAPSSGDVRQIFLMNHSLARMDAPLLASTQLTYAGGDSATVVVRRGSDSARTRRAAASAGMIPSLPQSFLAYELAAMRVRRAGVDSTTVTLLGPAGDATPVVVRRLGADSLTFTLPAFTYRARVDPDGRILGLRQPLGTTVERVPNVDIAAVAKAWAALDESGRAMGALSPLDSASGRVGDALVTVRYSRPRARGREVMGGLVPYDQVWRTGANAATVLETSRDLVVGNTALPAGRYTLFTVSTRAGATLVVSKETERGGQPLAGTDYDPARDFARIPMATRTLDAPVEQFTIAVVPAADANTGALRMAWGRREMAVTVRRR